MGKMGWTFCLGTFRQVNRGYYNSTANQFNAMNGTKSIVRAQIFDLRFKKQE